MKKESFYEKLRKKFVWVPLASIAAICTVIMTFHTCFHDDGTEEIVNILNEMKPPLAIVEMPDSTLNNPIIKDIRKIQDQVLIVRRNLSTIDLNPPKSSNHQEMANRYAAEIFKIINTGSHIEQILKDYSKLEPVLKSFGLTSMSSDISGWEAINDKYTEIAQLAKSVTVNASPSMPAKDKEKALKTIIKSSAVKDYVVVVNTETRSFFEELNAIQVELKNKIK